MKQVALPKLRQFGLFERFVDDAPRPPAEGQIIPLDFETHAVRMIVRDGETWWVAADVCRVLGISNSRDALSRLDDDEKGVVSTDTLGGSQDMATVNQSGLYSLIFTSRKPEAKRFKKWVTSEVLPSIRKTGTYSVPVSRVKQVARRLKTDIETAQARCDQIDTNKEMASWLAGNKARPEDYAAWNNAPHKAMFGLTAKELRPVLGLRHHGTPLDRMGKLALAINTHAKIVTNIKAKADGLPIPDAIDLLGDTAEALTAADLKRLGPGHQFDFVAHPKRGLVIDVTHKQLSQN